jgi:hypothetical protein
MSDCIDQARLNGSSIDRLDFLALRSDDAVQFGIIRLGNLGVWRVDLICLCLECIDVWLSIRRNVIERLMTI